MVSGKVLVGSSYNGFTKVTDVAVLSRVKTGYAVKDSSSLVDYLIRVAWSANEAKPTQDVSVVITSDSPIDAIAAAKKAGWTSADSFKGDLTDVYVDLREVKKRLGEWPGKVPVASASVRAAIRP